MGPSLSSVVLKIRFSLSSLVLKMGLSFISVVLKMSPSLSSVVLKIRFSLSSSVLKMGFSLRIVEIDFERNKSDHVKAGPPRTTQCHSPPHATGTYSQLRGRNMSPDTEKLSGDTKHKLWQAKDLCAIVFRAIPYILIP